MQPPKLSVKFRNSKILQHYSLGSALWSLASSRNPVSFAFPVWSQVTLDMSLDPFNSLHKQSTWSADFTGCRTFNWRLVRNSYCWNRWQSSKLLHQTNLVPFGPKLKFAFQISPRNSVPHAGVQLHCFKRICTVSIY